LVVSLDPKTAYWSSSPSKGWGRPESLLMGDVHYWGVWWGEQPFEMYKRKVGRFNSEFGFQSYPDYNTMLYFADSTELYFGSPIVEAHQKHPRGTRQINDFIEKYFYTSSEFEQYVYASQLTQLYGMQMAIDAQRSRMPRSMGSLYWQLNDSWPAVSWSSVDYFGRWKALHYGLRESFAPILLGMDTLEGKPNVIWVINESHRNLEVDLEVVVMDSQNVVSTMMHPLQVKHGEVVFVPTIFTPNVPDKINKNTSFIHLQLKENQQVLAERLAYFVHPNELQLPKPDVMIRSVQKDSFVELTIESRTWVKNIQLLSNIDGHFDRNYFDMLPNKTYTVKFYPSKKLQTNALRFTYRSIYDLKSKR
jgi:beta-mannosidase